eukprot:NODE_227_length_12294_cov_1.542681.p8 type:complete len:179 gc:universal NODE_227_length_12294_cov_1.542681:3408-3944(+)
MNNIYERLRIYEQSPTDPNCNSLKSLIEEQYLLIQHEHPALKKKITGELQSIRDRIAVISNKEKNRLKSEREVHQRQTLFQGAADHTGIQMGDLQMDYAHAQVDGMIDQGRKFISEISSQNMALKRMKNKVLTSLSTLGVSQSLIAKINTQLSSDMVVFWLLVLVFFGIVLLFYIYIL